MAMNNIPLPDTLEINSSNLSKRWDLFLQSWNNYEVATNLSERSQPQRVATLLSVIGTDPLEVYNTFEWAPDEEKTTTEVLQKLADYCKPRKNVTYERHKLMCTRQQDGETFDQYLTKLKLLAADCDYGSIKDSIIKDMVVFGINDEKLRENLLRDTEMTLEKATQMARAGEQAHSQANSMANRSAQCDQRVYKIKPATDHKTTMNQCRYCGLQHVFDRQKCPAFGKKCNKCNGLNHFARQCKVRKFNETSARQTKRINQVEESDDDYDIE